MDTWGWILAGLALAYQLWLIAYLVIQLRRTDKAWNAQKAEWAAQDARFAELERKAGLRSPFTPTP